MHNYDDKSVGVAGQDIWMEGPGRSSHWTAPRLDDGHKLVRQLGQRPAMTFTDLRGTRTKTRTRKRTKTRTKTRTKGATVLTGCEWMRGSVGLSRDPSVCSTNWRGCVRPRRRGLAAQVVCPAIVIMLLIS